MPQCGKGPGPGAVPFRGLGQSRDKEPVGYGEAGPVAITCESAATALERAHSFVAAGVLDVLVRGNIAGVSRFISARIPDWVPSRRWTCSLFRPRDRHGGRDWHGRGVWRPASTATTSPRPWPTSWPGSPRASCALDTGEARNCCFPAQVRPDAQQAGKLLYK